MREILNSVKILANNVELSKVSNVTDKLKLYRQETFWYAIALER